MYKKIKSSETDYHFIEYGKPGKPVIVFLHGYSDTAALFNHLATKLSKNYHVYSLDLPMVHEAKTVQSLDSLTKHLQGFVTALGLNKFRLAGFSLGGLVAVNYSYLYPDHITELYILNSVPRLLEKRMKTFYKYLKPMIANPAFYRFYSQLNTTRWLRKVFKDPPMSEECRRRKINNAQAMFGTVINILGEDLFEKYNSLSVPKTIVMLKDDTVISPKKYTHQLQHLKGKKIYFDRGGHAANGEYWKNIETLWNGS